MTVKRILLLAAVLSGAVMAHAQGMLYQSIAQTVMTIPGSAQGASQVFVPIPSAIVTVCTGIYTGIACNTQTASVYQDQALTIPITPNVTGDTVGNFWFWAAPGTYYYTVRGTVGGATVTGTYQIQLPASISGSTISAGTFNATTGFQVNSLAPLNHVLLGNGTDYVDSATIPASIVTGLPGSFYQYVQAAGVSQPQETKLNFADSVFALSDAAGTSQTNVNMNRTGVSSKITTASAAGTSGQAAVWTATGDLGSAAFQPPITSIDYYWTAVAACSTGTGQPVECSVDQTTALPGAMPNSNYQVFCTADVYSYVGAAPNYVCNMKNNTSVTPLPTAMGGLLTYNVTQVMQNGGSGGTVTVYFHAHHN